MNNQHGHTSHIERLSGISRAIGYFWQGVTYVGLALAVFVAFSQHPSLLARPRGWLIVLLVLAYSAWYYAGFRWMVGRAVDSYWRRRINGQGGRISWRGIVYWAGLFALTVALIALDDNFKYMTYPLYGLAFAIAALPDVLVLYVPACALMYIVMGWLPRDASLPQLASLGGSLFTVVIFTAMGYLPYYLLKGRFERERFYRELEQSHRELAQAHARLAASAGLDRELAVLRERTRLARDMHDTLGHALVLINVKLEASLRLRAVDAARADDEITATQQIVRDTMAELRAFLADLRSPLLQSEPCGEQLARLARELGARAGWTVSYAIDPNLPPLDEPIGEALLRVGAEALVNIERHAHARRVSLELRQERGDVVLTVTDDGVGILATNPPPAHAAGDAAADGEDALPDSPPGHYGIAGMRERVRALGGVFRISPRAGPAHGGRGTIVAAHVPLHPECVGGAASRGSLALEVVD